MVSPGRTLVCEAYPSIRGERYLDPGSMAVFCKSQSSEPAWAFSRRTRPLRLPEDPSRIEAQPGSTVAAARPARPTMACNISRRVPAETPAAKPCEPLDAWITESDIIELRHLIRRILSWQSLHSVSSSSASYRNDTGRSLLGGAPQGFGTEQGLPAMGSNRRGSLLA